MYVVAYYIVLAISNESMYNGHKQKDSDVV